MICELVKHQLDVFAKLVVAALRYPSIVVRACASYTEDYKETWRGGRSIHNRYTARL